jgi:NADP-dependent 3-hydroxy acid dehydrogenase YdfG
MLPTTFLLKRLLILSKNSYYPDRVGLNRNLKKSVLELWALVNNAGVFSCHGPDAWCTTEEYKRAFDVNTLGMIRCTHV